MSILDIFTYTSVLCCLLNITIITFPEAYKKTGAKKKINILIIISSAIYCVIFIALIIANHFCQVPIVEFNISLLVILLLTIIVFAMNIYYPALRMCVVANQNKCSAAKDLYGLIIEYRFCSLDERKVVIKNMELFLQNYEKILFDSSNKVLFQKLFEYSTTSTNRAPEKLIEMAEKSCLNLIDEANQQENPFSHISLISSFSLSSLLTILIALLSL